MELVETGRTRWIFAEGTEAWVGFGPVPDNLTVRLVDGRTLAVSGRRPEFDPTGPFERPELPWAALRASLVADGMAAGPSRRLELPDGTTASLRVEGTEWVVEV